MCYFIVLVAVDTALSENLMATMYDVAEKAGVSIATVSAVLNKTAYVSPELAKRVKQAVEELDYTINHLAHSLQTRSTHTIGMLIPDVASPDPFFGQVVRGAEDVLRKKGYLLILGHTYNKVDEQTRYLSAFRSRLVDGVLLFQAPGADSELDRLLKTKKPLVFVGRVPKDAQADIVATDIVQGTRMAVEHLLKQGHRRIGLITVAASLSVSSFRIEGWRSALRRNGVAADESYIMSGDMSSEAGKQAALRLLDLPEPPTAVFADNLVVATGILRALKERQRRVPEDITVLSSDDAEWLDVFTPHITTVVQPSYELGFQAAELLLKRIKHPKRPYQKVLLKPQLRIR
jgi:DNA-binding LacI/PurR family transcriptional regulator